jgi:hypothetical protein
VEEETNKQLKVQINALDAIIFLPDYLMDEILSEDGSINSEDMHEFRPSMLYMEQMLRVMPREITCRWRLLPAFEESLMRIEDARNQDIHKV